MNFQLLPAIDILDGRCVRLYKGSCDQVTAYERAPWNQAADFAHDGATMLHVVDLDGARDGASTNLHSIRKICEHVDIPVEVGGGIRSAETAQQLFTVGVTRIILGTTAVENPTLLDELLSTYGREQIVIGLDARESGTTIATRGWETITNLDVIEFAKTLAARGVTRIIYTDIARDGTLTFPNFEMIEKLILETKLHIIASGGVSQIEHLKLLRSVGAEGAILGKALYERQLLLTDAVKSLG